MGIRRIKHAVYDLKYHLVWVPKYRAHILDKEVGQYVKEDIKWQNLRCSSPGG
ncbi:MAG: transposase [Chloroflexi bacterium]|nr:transposase [Chloroflexota bacterium]